MKESKIVLKIFDFCGLHCVTIEEGALLYKSILKALKDHERVYLDFEGVLVITSSFLNASVGRLIGKLKDEFGMKIHLRNLEKRDVELIELVIENAKEHFGKSSKEKQIETIINRRLMG